jgi:hypothetical protein
MYQRKMYCDVLTIGRSCAIEQLRSGLSNPETAHKYGLAFFYCDFRRLDYQDPINILGSLAAQLCRQFESYPETLELDFDQSCQNGAQKRRADVSQLKRIIEYHANARPVILLIDALDECEKKEVFFDFMLKLLEDNENVKIMVTSREEIHIEQRLGQFARLRLESFMVNLTDDIHHYVDTRLENDVQFRWLTPGIKSDITQSLDLNSEGM